MREAPSGLFNESIIRSRAYLRKYDSNGNDLWARAIDADENDFVNGLAVDREGNVYVAGTAGPADSPSIPLGLLHTNTDAFLAKFDPAGSRIGPIHESGTDGDDGATAIGIDGNGMVYVTGFTDGADYLARYDTDLIKTAFLVQFDAEGRGRWVREYGALFESSSLLAVGADKSEAVYVAGGSGSKRFLAAYDAQGNAAWPQVQFSEFRYGSAIAAFGGAVYQAAGALIAKHDSKGNLQWIYQLDQAAYTSSTLTAGPPGVYIAGQTTGRVELFSKNATQHVFAGKLMPELARAPSITGPEQER